MKNSTIRILAALLAAGVTLTSGSVTTFAAGRVVGGPSVTLRAAAGVPAETVKSLTDAIAEATELLNATEKSADGTDVPTTKKWVTETDWNTFSDAIADAQAIVDDDTSNETAVNGAVTTLSGAKDTFVAAQQDGTKVEAPDTSVNKTELNTKIGEAQTLLDSVKSSADGSDVSTKEEWVTPTYYNALQTAITNGTTVKEKADATEQEVTEAVTALTTAMKDVSDNKAPGSNTDEVTPPAETNKEKLTAAIAAAKEMLNATVKNDKEGEGVESGFWATTEAWNEFNTAIQAAEAVTEEAECAEALTTLNAAKTKFEGLRHEVEGTVDPTPDPTVVEVANLAELKPALAATKPSIKLTGDIELDAALPLTYKVALLPHPSVQLVTLLLSLLRPTALC